MAPNEIVFVATTLLKNSRFSTVTKYSPLNGPLAVYIYSWEKSVYSPTLHLGTLLNNLKRVKGHPSTATEH